MDNRLRFLKRWTFSVFDVMSQLDLDYRFCFSAGKDSHLLMVLYFEWEVARNKKLNAKTVFSDTFLEAPKLYELATKMDKVCSQRGMKFVKVQPDASRSIWVLMVGLGYPVPDWQVRWCTSNLKINPMERAGGVPVTGAHRGESQNRDSRLNNCGSSECGIDLIEKKVEPISKWRNCDVWDYLFYKGDRFLYDGFFDSLRTLYSKNENEEEGLRMGCFMCPVIAKAPLAKNVELGVLPPISIAVRSLLEELRCSPRLRSPRTHKNGALHIDGRRRFWDKLQPYISELLQYGWISQEIITEVERMLDARTYPPTYPLWWIRDEESKLFLSNTGQS